MDWQALAQAVLKGRPELFERDYREHQPRLRAEFGGRTVCVIGAGGSIGRATAEALLALRPKRTLLVDLSENNLAEVTRRLRNRCLHDTPDFEAWALDYTREPFFALLERERPDIVLNFAAYKHVRSEKDHLTLAEMLRVNVLGNLKLLQWSNQHPLRRFFVISTDKAVQPASCMGATKRLMEQLLLAALPLVPAPARYITSTRFANVLFSDGSLPASFVQRLEQQQPLAGPSDIVRYFITPQEAARLCLLAACHESSGEILIPRMRPEDQLSFVTIAERFLELHGLKLKNYGADTAAATAQMETDRANGQWPGLFSPATTSGEKAAEEFCAPDESASALQPYTEILAIESRTARPWAELTPRLEQMCSTIADADWLRTHSKPDLVAWLQELVPNFAHLETRHSLDQKL